MLARLLASLAVLFVTGGLHVIAHMQMQWRFMLVDEATVRDMAAIRAASAHGWTVLQYVCGWLALTQCRGWIVVIV